jgi:hypothetical protein
MSAEENAAMVARAVAVVEAAEAQGVLVRMLGGCAILLRTDAALREWIALDRGRTVLDVDLVCRRRDRARLPAVMAGLGYSEDARMNALHGRVRNVFTGEERHRQWEADVFFDQLPMCHVLDFSARLELESPTLPVIDLLLAKLQIVELNEKDALDVCCLLGSQAGSAVPDLDRLLDLTSRDWGLFHTIELNLPKVASVAHTSGLPAPWRDRATSALDAIGAAMEQAPKSARWRARARLGDRVRWYELVEEARR